MRGLGVAAGDIGIQSFDAMRKAVPGQELQRPIGSRRLGAEPVRRQPVQNLVGTQRAMLAQKQLQRAAPGRGQAQPLGPAPCLG